MAPWGSFDPWQDYMLSPELSNVFVYAKTDANRRVWLNVEEQLGELRAHPAIRHVTYYNQSWGHMSSLQQLRAFNPGGADPAHGSRRQRNRNVKQPNSHYVEFACKRIRKNSSNLSSLQ